MNHSDRTTTANSEIQATPGRRASLLQGVSYAHDAPTATQEIWSQIDQPELTGLIVFCSPDYDLTALARELDRLADGVPVIGCTTAGELTPEGYSNNSLTAVSFSATGTTIRSICT